MFSHGSSSSTSLAMVTPSLVIVGAPHFFSRTTLRPLGPSVTLTMSASLLTPASSPLRASSLKRSSLAAMCVMTPGSADDGEEIALGDDEVLDAFVLHLGAAVLRVEDDVADADVDGDALAVLVSSARAHRYDLARLG